MGNWVQKRENFRIVFPSEERPTATLLKSKYPVIDLSAAGVRIRAGKEVSKFNETHKEIAIKITFKSGKFIDVIGSFKRADSQDVVFVLSLEIPLSVMNQEQIRLRKNYSGH